MIRIYADTGRCVGAGHCVRAAPAVFDQREVDGIVVLRVDEAPDHLAPNLVKAEHLCPSQAIRLEFNK